MGVALSALSGRKLVRAGVGSLLTVPPEQLSGRAKARDDDRTNARLYQPTAGSSSWGFSGLGP